MGVFADSDEREVDGGGLQCLPYGADDVRGILFTVQQLVAADTCFSNEPLHEIIAEASRVSDGKSDVLIQMEHFDAVPIDPGSCGEELQEVDL